MSRRLTVTDFVIGILIAPFAVLALGVVALVVDDARDAHARRGFERIPLNARVQDVEAMMGSPDASRSCGENLWWGGDADYRGKNDGRCVIEVRYQHFLSAWAVGYSEEGRVVSKYHYVSE